MDGPSYLHRLWYIFEAFTAIENDCYISFGMPPEQDQGMCDDLLSDFSGLSPTQKRSIELKKLYRVLAASRGETAAATFPSDRKMILDLIQNRSGFSATNRAMNKCFRQMVPAKIGKWLSEGTTSLLQCACNWCPPALMKWFVRCLLAALLLAAMIVIAFANNLATFFWRHGQYEKSIEYFGKALRLCKRKRTGPCGCLNTRTGIELCECLQCIKRGGYSILFLANVHAHLAGALHDKGKNQEALLQLEKTLDYMAPYRRTTPLYATICNRRAKLLLDQGKLNEALEAFQSVERMHQRAKRGKEPVVIATQRGIAEVYYAKGDYPRVLEFALKGAVLIPEEDAVPETDR